MARPLGTVFVVAEGVSLFHLHYYLQQEHLLRGIGHMSSAYLVQAEHVCIWQSRSLPTYVRHLGLLKNYTRVMPR